MNPEQHNAYLEEVKHVIRDTVNGKIDKIDAKMDAYIKKDEEWKKTAEPVIKLGNNLGGAGKFMVIVFGGIATIAGGLLIIKKLFV